jgi:hypothetical protein
LPSDEQISHFLQALSIVNCLNFSQSLLLRLDLRLEKKQDRGTSSIDNLGSCN